MPIYFEARAVVGLKRVVHVLQSNNTWSWCRIVEVTERGSGQRLQISPKKKLGKNYWQSAFLTRKVRDCFRHLVMCLICGWFRCI